MAKAGFPAHTWYPRQQLSIPVIQLSRLASVAVSACMKVILTEWRRAHAAPVDKQYASKAVCRRLTPCAYNGAYLPLASRMPSRTTLLTCMLSRTAA